MTRPQLPRRGAWPRGCGRRSLPISKRCRGCRQAPARRPCIGAEWLCIGWSVVDATYRSHVAPQDVICRLAVGGARGESRGPVLGQRLANVSCFMLRGAAVVVEGVIRDDPAQPLAPHMGNPQALPLLEQVGALVVVRSARRPGPSLGLGLGVHRVRVERSLAQNVVQCGRVLDVESVTVRHEDGGPSSELAADGTSISALDGTDGLNRGLAQFVGSPRGVVEGGVSCGMGRFAIGRKADRTSASRWRQ